MKDFMWYFWRAFKNMLKFWLGFGLLFCVAALLAYVLKVLVNYIGETFAIVATLAFASLIVVIVNAIFDYKIDKEGWR